MAIKDTILQVLESSILKCGQAVLDGNLTVQEYEKATGRSGDDLKKQIENTARQEFKHSVEAIRAQALAATQAVYDKLIAAGMEQTVIEDILGDLTVEDGAVTAPDWSKVTQ